MSVSAMTTAPLVARAVEHALQQLPADLQARALSGRGNDRRIRAALASLHAAGRIPSISRRDMSVGVAWLVGAGDANTEATR